MITRKGKRTAAVAVVLSSFLGCGGEQEIDYGPDVRSSNSSSDPDSQAGTGCADESGESADEEESKPSETPSTGGRSGSIRRGGGAGDPDESGDANNSSVVRCMVEHCADDWGAPPDNVSDWIDESWDGTLGVDMQVRHAWLFDAVMNGAGAINICVRWGATSAPSDKLKREMASAASRWFNDWFRQLAGYGCFPFNEISVAVTGWAVRPENAAWVADLEPQIKTYTEVDQDGFPTCSRDCGFLYNSSHRFPDCEGGDANHYDYFIWLDDSLSEGVAALGGDWGLRMPVASFEAAMGTSNPIIEHEIGHGFGFADYYDWSGAKPEGGSLMIIGSTASLSPTIADTWLLRRTWREIARLRGW